MVSPLWFGAYLLIIAVTIGLGLLFYDQAPSRIPMKFDFNGHVYNTVEKSYRTLLFGPIVQLFISIIFGFSYWMIGKSKQQIDSSNSNVSIEQNRVFRYRWSLFIVFGGLAMVLMFSFMQMSMLGIIKNLQLASLMPMVISGLIVIAVIVLAVTTGQSGNRVHVYAGKDNQKKTVTRDDDKYWKLGSFYYNPEDPSIFIEKRFGIGWTMNWARPLSWIITIAFLIFIAGFAILSTLFMK